jgi:hypothetical protein
VSGAEPDRQTEIERIQRVSDLLCSAHSALRDRYARRAVLLDLSILSLSIWLAGIAFVQPQIGIALTPIGANPQLWAGLLAIFTALLSVLQLKVDWKGVSEAHRHAANEFADVHRESGYLLNSAGSLDDREERRLLDRYDMASSLGINIPETEFLAQKRRHLSKIAVSKYLDSHPSASIRLTRTKFWFRDNIGKGENRER